MTRTAPPADQRRLLHVQELDARRDRLAHQARTLPEKAEVARLEAERTATATALQAARTAGEELATTTRRAEGEVDTLRTRLDKDRKRLDAGTASTQREVDALTHGIETLVARQDELEEALLELMQQAEDNESEVARLEAELARLESEVADATRRRDEVLAGIGAEDAELVDERSREAALVPDDLLALYEKLRATHDGVGAAALQGTRCTGCHLDLAGSALAEVHAAAPDAVVRCDECGRILVRDVETPA